jgi:hypothetical protein
VQETAHAAEVVVLQGGLFEAPDPVHVTEQTDLIRFRKLLVDGRSGFAGRLQYSVHT